MNEYRNPSLSSYARKLRTSMTKEERHLWYDFFKELPVTVRRQKIFGPYIVDFYCAEARLVIELDGSQHYEWEGQEKDQVRDRYLQSLGLTVLRYSNLQVRQEFESVCQDIWNHIPSLQAKASPQGEAGKAKP